MSTKFTFLVALLNQLFAHIFKLWNVHISVGGAGSS